jgi:predicted nucleotidyltransferase component of viral defense system
MNEAVRGMLERYSCQQTGDYVQALREIVQELALLGLWRSRFFEHAAFYGGTALRILYGLNRFSEDLDFSLLSPSNDFDIARYSEALTKEINAFGFDSTFTKKVKSKESPIDSAFLKMGTRQHLLTISAGDNRVKDLPMDQLIKIRLEVDTQPPPGFATETKMAFLPIPFSIRAYSLPDLFAGKMHAVLCRQWKNRVKGRDWFDLVWYAGRYPKMHLRHLEERMRQSGHWDGKRSFDEREFRRMAHATVTHLNIDQARREVEPFLKDSAALTLWSHPYFTEIVERIQCV